MKYPDQARRPAQFGLSLLALCSLILVAEPESARLADIYAGNTYRMVTGILAAALLAVQWSLLNSRSAAPQGARTRMVRHYWLGAVAPLFLLAHATSAGYGYQSALAWAYVANCGLGLMAPMIPTSSGSAWPRAWMPMHIIGAILVTALVLIHIVVVFRYN